MMALLIFLVVLPPIMGTALVGAIYFQARNDQAQAVDAIVVLGTTQYHGRPSPVLRARLDRTVEMFEAGHAPIIVVTGGRQPGDAFTEAEASRNYLVEQGVPESAILLENVGRDSWQSMQGVAEMLAERDARRVLLVSDGFHLFRVKLMARDLGLEAYATPAIGSPIQGGAEFSYVVREAAAVVVYLWESR